MKIGRNDPCPCGSGKKYKKCCLKKDELKKAISLPKRRTAEESVDSLRGKIMKFIDMEKLKGCYPAALDQYWKTPKEGLDPRAMVETDMFGFTEWFVHDYVLPDFGKPLITVYLESNPKLTRTELQILKDWQATNISVYQITRVEENNGVYCEDIFTDEEFFIHDISISRSIKQWELLMARKVWVLDEWQLSAVGATLPPGEKKNIYDFVMGHYLKHLKAHPNTSLSDFLQQKGYLLRQYVITKEVEPAESPRIVTSHGEEMVIYEAIYDVIDCDLVVEKLSKISDYQMTGYTEHKDGEVLNYTFDWLERGESSKQFEGKHPKEGMIFQSFFTEGPGHESYRVLGNLESDLHRLKLSAMGEGRFKVGKTVLEKNLEPAVKHRLDSIQTLESKLSEDMGASDAKEIDPEIQKEIIKDFFDKHYRDWLDSKIPALGDKTPRQAARTKEGRRELEELLRLLEYREQSRRENGQPEYDIAWIRKELGIEKK
ncbi:MAG: SEC-C domain-containing protein [Desulfobacterales bacterium]|nr:MAG: SEC-C domain-containing protein [Desulfobacterales bacterium]